MSSPSSAVHSVHIYEQDSDLITRLCAIISTSLRLGDSVLIVATSDHREQLVKVVENAGVDVRACVREGRYTMLDATETLRSFMVNGRPDRLLFMSTVGNSLAAVRSKALSRSRGLTVFGEMVAVLWDDGNKAGALELEALWNAVLNDSAFHLHCAYPRAGFVNESDMHAVCGTHSHVLQ